MENDTVEQKRRAECLDEVAKLVRAKAAPAQQATIEAFTRKFYGNVDPDDLAERQPADLCGAALSLWALAQQRDSGQARVRVFNPSREKDGWKSPHSIVQIINDDMPFIVDSVTMEINRHDLALHLIIHPIFSARRNARGGLEVVTADKAADTRRESMIQVEVDRISDSAQLVALVGDIERVLGDVRVAVADWRPMQQKVLDIVAEIEQRPPPFEKDVTAIGCEFLRWLAVNHFTFLGYRRHVLLVVDGGDALKIVPGTSLGILREGTGKEVATSFAALPPEVRAYARRPELLVITKSTARSTVHHPGYLTHIAVKRFDDAGDVCGEDRFLGLFTSTAYSANPAEIPLLRRKVANLIAQAGAAPDSHTGKTLQNILATYPRDELFQTSEEDLLHIVTGILQLGDRHRFRIFVRRDPFERFLSCLIYAPRDRYTTEVRRRWQAILTEAFNGLSTDYNVHVSESKLARVHMIVRTTPGAIPDYNLHDIEVRLAEAARRWSDDLKLALLGALDEEQVIERLHQFGEAFPASYREEVPATAAVSDIETMMSLTLEAPLAVKLYRPPDAGPGMLRVKLLHLGAPVPLSDSLPMLEHMGLRVIDERPHRIAPAGMAPVWLHDFGLFSSLPDPVLDTVSLHAVFEDAFGRIFRGDVESDNFNQLVVAAHIPATEVVVLRAYSKYLRQIGFPLSQTFIQNALAAHAGIANLLIALFRARFDPDGGAAADDRAAESLREIESALDAVDNLSEDRTLRQFIALILATTRTNFWRRDDAGKPRTFLSFKFDPAKVPGLPEPRPMFEIFVYARRFEGVHLRGGRVARGGLRWSDRLEDFRTEVLGLVKAQMVKNTVIVPVGSKGGFVLKRAPSPSDREAWMKEGIACYQNYLRGLLDLTDNRVDDAIVPPPQVRRHDSDDPYLVVAADKGTATFSDYANGISAEYGFWLGDAFASGGSVGYDHKAMGITARGAWESVKRHFREMGVNTQSMEFTVAGIGDMSGDVFGNGMLLSNYIRLIAAFDHRHIFLDPDPDVAASFAERQRLFALPRSSWADYDVDLLSEGGGIHSRTAKSIRLTPQVQAMLAISAASLTPTELVNAILKAPVDLIYNGGIGTYVKAQDETHAEVGDRANDALRVNGRDLRCKVFAEGGNLGATQLGRVEFAAGGGRIYTDAIDNSAGVDTSDHEVNIKILLGIAVADGKLTEKRRNTLLAKMTDDIAALVLRDNYFQTQVLSVASRIAPSLFDAQVRFMQFLEKAGRLNRAIEFLPDDEVITERRAEGRGLTTPETAVLLAYSKIWLYDELLASPLPDGAWVVQTLIRYFPKALRKQYADSMARHPLKREIIATYVVNSMLNRVGSTFVHRLSETTGAKPHEIVRAFLLSREVFGLVAFWKGVEALDNIVPDAIQSQMLIDTRTQIERGTTWFLRSPRLHDAIVTTVGDFRPAVEALSVSLSKLQSPGERARVEAEVGALTGAGVPEDLAQRVVSFETLYAALDIAEVAKSAGKSIEPVAAVYFELADRLGLPWLAEKISALPGDKHWQSLVREAMQDDLSGMQRAATAAVVADAPESAKPSALIDAWTKRNQRVLGRAAQLLTEVRALPVVDGAMLAVVLRELRSVA